MKQNTVALSTAKAEYVSASEATTQAIWLQFVLDDFGEMQAEATSLFCDNMSAISMAKNPIFHHQTKHIEIDQHFIKEKLDSGLITTAYVPSGYQLANVLTKALPTWRFQDLTGKLGMIDIHSPA